MQFLVGLGNPGEKYQNSRHNIGFMVLEEVLRQQKGEELRSQSKFRALLAKHEDLVFVEPQTFMNESGQAVRAVLEYYDKSISFQTESQLSQLWVIHDDLDLEVGKHKIQFGTGPKVHNGLSSVDDCLHTNQYWHVRIGVDGRGGDRSIPSPDYVLASFLPEEKKIINNVIKDVGLEILHRLAVGA